MSTIEPRAVNPEIHRGTLSGTLRGTMVAQEMHVDGAPVMVLRNTAGEVKATQPLEAPTSGHQVTPDGRSVFILTEARDGSHGPICRLTRLDMADGARFDFGLANRGPLAVDETRLAYFLEDRLIVVSLEGEMLMERTIAPAGAAQGVAVCALLPENRVAYARGHRLHENIADIAVLDAEGNESVKLELTTHETGVPFTIAGLYADNLGKRIAILGREQGLVIADIAAGIDIAESYPAPDLGDGQPGNHAKRFYRRFAFDPRGVLAVGLVAPGWLCIWNIEGDMLGFERVPYDPDATQLLLFDDAGVAYLDSTGVTKHFSVPEKEPPRAAERAFDRADQWLGDAE